MPDTATPTIDKLYGIAELAERHGVTQRAIRFYESKDLLSPQRVGGQRVYTEADSKRLTLILRAKSIGTKIADIKTFLELYGREGEGRVKQLEFVIDMTAREMAKLEAKRDQIDATLAELRVIHDGSKARLAKRRGS